jgi:tetratricopeptide (TPR) repeat protein
MSITRLLLPLVLIFSWTARADQPSPTYSEGLSLFQQGKVDEAKQKFENVLQEQGPSPYVLYNLGLAEFKSGHNGKAVALWRKALDLDPNFSPALDALGYASEKMKIKELPHKITAGETLRNKFLVNFTLSSFLFLSLVFFFAFGWFLLIFLGQRTRFKKGEGKPPAFPVTAVVLGLIFAGSVFLAASKALDQNLPRATIVVDKVEAHASPGSGQATLFELFEGMEVIVRELIQTDNNEKWMQVTYPGGMTGWIPSDSVMHSSGRNPEG